MSDASCLARGKFCLTFLESSSQLIFSLAKVQIRDAKMSSGHFEATQTISSTIVVECSRIDEVSKKVSIIAAWEAFQGN